MGGRFPHLRRRKLSPQVRVIERKEMTDEQYAAWPYKDMNGFCLDIGDTVKIVSNMELFKIVIFSLDGEHAFVNNELRSLKLPLGKVLWVK